MDDNLMLDPEQLEITVETAVYKHVVLGMVFLKYVSDSFETRRQELVKEFIDPKSDYYLSDDANDELVLDELENRDYYTEKNVFWVPAAARWKYIQDNIRLSIKSTQYLDDNKTGPIEFITEGIKYEKNNSKLSFIFLLYFVLSKC